MKKVMLIVLLTIAPQLGISQGRPPIIDMHLHANSADQNGPPPLAICVPFVTQFPAYDGARPWLDVFLESFKNPQCTEPVWSSDTDDSLMDDTLSALARHNIVGVLGGIPERVRKWREASPNRIIPATVFYIDGEFLPVDQLREYFESGEFVAMAEIAPQYIGIAPNDERLEPYWSLAEELQIPVGFHMVDGIPGINSVGFPDHRVRLANPYLLEDVLIRHPRLRVYVMHYGSPMIDEMVAMLVAFPNLYIEIGGLQWFFPREYFYGQLKQFIDAGFGNRVMFGSDQMNWPGIIDHSVSIIEEAPFLSKEQKRDIFYNNAARFLRLSQKDIAAHHQL